MIIEGAIAVKAALNSKYRKIIRIYIDEDKHTSDVSYITQQAYTNRLNVERCSKEKIDELATGKTVRSSIKIGFQKAMSAILDGNITTLIAALVLWFLGTGTVKGFAQTLALGIALKNVLQTQFESKTV